MIGYDIKCKYPYSYNSLGKQLDEAFDCIQLQEPHEAGEIINDYYLIINEVSFGSNNKLKSKFDIGDYVRIIDIRFFDIFGTDFDYDNRVDLRKYKSKIIQYNENGETKKIIVNLYGYK